MKLIDKNGKLFGKISILDIVIVVCIAFIAAVFVLGKSDKLSLPISTNSNVEYSASFKAYSVDKGMRSPFEVGDKLFGNNGEYIGVIVSVEEKPTISKEKLQDGTYIDYENPKYVDYYITVEGKGTSTDKGTFAEGTFALYPNNAVVVSSKYFYGNAIVLSVEKKV